MSITAPFSATRNGVQTSLVVGLPNQYVPMQLTLNTSTTILLDSYYIPTSSSSSTFPKTADGPTWFKGYTSNSDPGADYSTGADYFKLNAVQGTANASQLVLPALLRRDPTNDIRAQWDNSGGILGAGPGPALSCPYFTATVPTAKEPQGSVFQGLIGSLTSPTGTPLEPYSAFGLYFTSADGGWMDVGAFNECVLGSKMLFFDQSRPCQWSMRLDNLYVLTYGERSYAAVPVVTGVDSVAIGFDLSLDGFAGPYKVMQPLIALLTFGANKYAETVFNCLLMQRMHNVMLSASTGIDLDYSLFVNQTITGPGNLTCSFKFKVDNDTSVQNTFTLGKPFFHKYYVGFHYPTSKVGIAKLIPTSSVSNYTNCRTSWQPTSADIGQSSWKPSGRPSGRSDGWQSGPDTPIPPTDEPAPASNTMVIALSVVAAVLLLSGIALFVFCQRRRNSRAKLAKVQTENAGNTTPHSEPVPAPTPVPVSGPRLIPRPMALPTMIVGSEEMVLVPMSVARSMFARESVPLASRQAPPPPPLPFPIPMIPSDKTHHKREMQEIRQASGVGLGPGDHEGRVRELSVLQAAAAAASSSSSSSTVLTGESSSTSGTKDEI